ncbi:hypothetical protein [Flavobacterium sp.]|uniref:hypothetical protein n=1 Tax=Flavobacterium sp. TaxID=239 RepID=UPI00261108FE|nr:hypothetical protein [Flavobacterium sp.]
MKNIIEQLKKGILSATPVLNSSLVSAKTWKRAQYIILSEIISDQLSKSPFLQGAKKNELGTTISSTTLQRIFTNDYSNSENSDLRFLKTLDKLAIFIGFPSLNHFLSNSAITIEMEEFNPLTMNKDEKILLVFEKLITSYCQEEFNSLLKLPEVDLGNLSHFIFENGPLTQRIHDLISQIAQLGHLLNNNNNRSNFELYDFNICSLDDHLAVVTVKEFWNLEFRDDYGTFCNAYNHVNKQTYFIKKQNNVWKIWDNHNPDYKTIINDMTENMKKNKKNPV